MHWPSVGPQPAWPSQALFRGPWTGLTQCHFVQIATISARIGQLTRHLQQHKKDYSTTRGLYQLLGRRKRLLLYLYNTKRCVQRALSLHLEAQF